MSMILLCCTTFHSWHFCGWQVRHSTAPSHCVVASRHGCAWGLQGRNDWLQAGAGLVADSVPESEYQETINKANAMSRAIDLAEDAFVEDTQSLQPG